MSSREVVAAALLRVDSERPKVLSRELVDLAESAKGYVRDARAKLTLVAYERHWRHFRRWCEGHELPAMPAEPETLCMYLAARADEGRKAATLAVAISAIAYAHARAGHESPHQLLLVKETWKGVRRRVGVAPTQKAPLSARELRAIMETLPRGLAGVRDRALLLLGFSGAFRRGELVALEHADLRFTRAGLECTVRHSKTDQEGAGMVKVVAYGGDLSTCPVRAVQDWLGLAGIVDGPVFRRVRRNGLLGESALTGQVVALLVKRSVCAIGLDSAEYAGHSLRAGFVTSAKELGADDPSIMAQTGHTSLAMVHRYHRRTRLWERPASAKLGL